MYLVRFLALGCLVCSLSTIAKGQFSGAIGVNAGVESTQYGGPNAYQYPKRTTPIIDISPVITLGGKSDRDSGWSVSAGGDLVLPTNTSDATGNPTEYAGNVSIDWRFKFMGLGGGVEAREFLMPSDKTYSRPDLFLFGVPFHYKVTFGPHNAAYVQAGVTAWVYGSTESSNTTNQSLKISDNYGNSNIDLRATAGYLFAAKHTALKFLYVHRGVYFDPTTSLGDTVYGMDFKQDAFGGGVTIVF
jgi:hypothetical protein